MQGITDTTYEAEFPATVKLTDKGASGTLVTPYWVLSAEHVFDESGEDEATWTWFVGAFPSGDSNDPNHGEKRLFEHTRVKSGLVKLWRPSSEINYREHDLALVRVDRPVRHPIGLPAQLPMTPGACGTNGFLGRLVGFAHQGYDENGYGGADSGLCGLEVSVPQRRFGPSALAWERYTYTWTGSSYQHYFEAAPGQACTELAGIGVGGDSGGSLYRSGGMLCGVISGDGYWASGGSPTSTVWSQYHTAAVDDADAIAWWSQYIFDVDGRLESPCPPPDAYNDPDGDGIPASCDTCPSVYNPEQLTNVHDDDLDGVGNVCDLCPGDAVDPVDQVINRNFEIEFAKAFPNLEEIPVFDRADFSNDVAFEEAVASYNAAFFPDKCDPMPIPTAVLQDGGELPNAPTPYTSDPICVMFTQGCTSSFNNVIEMRVSPSEDVLGVIQQSGPVTATVGLRWCDCQFAQDASPHHMAGRTKCRQDFTADCRFDEDLYSDTSPSNMWLEIETKDHNQTWNQAETGDEWAIGIGGTNKKSVVFNYQALGSQYLDQSTNFESVNGMLWIHVLALSATVPGIGSGSSERPLTRFANGLSSGAASWGYYPEGHLWAAVNDWIVCPMCGPDAVTQPLHEAGNPHWSTTLHENIGPVGLPDSATLAYYDAVAVGDYVHVSASEPLTWLSRVYFNHTRFTRAVGLDVSAGDVTAVLLSQGLDALPIWDEFESSGSPPNLEGDEGLAFSAFERRLYVLGGSGDAENTGFFLDLEQRAWRDFPFPSGEEVGPVLAAVYRHEDRSVYFLELDRSSERIELRKWNAQRTLDEGVIVDIAEFPSTWDAFGKYALVAGPRGEIGVVAYEGTGSDLTRIGYFAVDDAATLEMAGFQTFDDVELLAPPHMTPDAFVYTTTDPASGRLTYESMEPPTGGEMLQMFPH